MVNFHVKIRGERKILDDLAWAQRRMADPFHDPLQVQVIVAAAIMKNMDAECDPEGIPWDRLSKGYKDWKDTVAPGNPIGDLFGIMKTMDNLMGVAVVTGTTMTMTYGIHPTAVYHAICFTEGGLVSGTSQPPRPFYGLPAAGEADLNGYFEQSFAYLTR